MSHGVPARRWFEPIRPAADLAQLLECRWEAVAAGHHDLVPDGCMDLLWIEGSAAWLCGPDTHGWSIDLPGGTAVSGVRFRPGAAAAVFRQTASAMVDQRVRVGDLLGDATERRLVQRLSDTAGLTRAAEKRSQILEAFVRHRADGADPDPMVAAAVLVSAGGVADIPTVAVATGLSTRQLRRRFGASVGYSPAFYARVARLQRFIGIASRRAGVLGLAELAVAAGYTDQPHLGRDCRELARMTPRQLVDGLWQTSAAPTVADGRSIQDGPGDELQPSAA